MLVNDDGSSVAVELVMTEADLAFQTFGLVKNEWVYHTVQRLTPATDFDNVLKVKIEIRHYSQKVFKVFLFPRIMSGEHDVRRMNIRKKLHALLAAMDLEQSGKSEEEF